MKMKDEEELAWERGGGLGVSARGRRNCDTGPRGEGAPDGLPTSSAESTTHVNTDKKTCLVF